MLLERPSWWNARHSLWVLAGTAVVFCASLAWVAVLRAQVRTQTRIIGQKIQREAALEERTRIARDLHDDLGASLTHISFLSEVARKESAASAGIEEHLREISGSTQEAFQSLDEIVWLVNPKNDTFESLVSQICHFAAHFFRGTPTRCRFDVPGNLPERPLPTDLRNHVFFAVKEALNNVRKHAAASEVMLRVRLGPGEACCISIEDNGRGIKAGAVPSDRNGLANLRQRLEGAGGQFALESSPGSGTRIHLTFLL
jgi:signal transduction histidine kinase